MKKTVIIVLGMHRSGTSALTGLLEKLGIDLGTQLLPSSGENEKGFFENIKVLDLNEKILEECKSSWDDITYDINISPKKKKKFVKYAKKIIEDEFIYSNVFAIKDPRLCLTFPIWEEALLNMGIKIRVVIPYRNPFETAKSLKKRNGFSYEKSLLLWAKYFYHAEKYSQGYKRVFVSFDALVNNPKEELFKIKAFLKLKHIKMDLVKNFIDPKLKHHNLSTTAIDESVPCFVKEIVYKMQDKSISSMDNTFFNTLREELIGAHHIFYKKDVLDHLDTMNRLQNENVSLRKKAFLLDHFEEITHFDKAYYLENNQDVQESGIDPLEHFIMSGMKEKRMPNYFCEKNTIIVNELGSMFIEKFSLLQKEEIQYRLEEEKHLLEEQKVLEKNRAEVLEQEKGELEHRLEEEKSRAEVLEQEKGELEHRLEEEKNKIKELEQQFLQENEILQSKVNELETKYQEKLEIIKALNQQIDEIIKDLASIKENKCWIYTKPIRDLQKVLKGK